MHPLVHCFFSPSDSSASGATLPNKMQTANPTLSHKNTDKKNAILLLKWHILNPSPTHYQNLTTLGYRISRHQMAKTPQRGVPRFNVSSRFGAEIREPVLDLALIDN